MKPTGFEKAYRIMVIDDSSNVLKAMELMLKKEFDLAMAVSGEEALDKIKEFKPDLVLLDVEMEGIDGYETCARIREQPDFSDIAIIHISGNDSLEDRLKGYEAGADDYMIKPIHARELKAKIFTFVRLKEQVKTRKLEEQRLQERIEKLEETIESKNNEIDLLSQRYRYEFEQKVDYSKLATKKDELLRNIVNNHTSCIFILQDGFFKYANTQLIRLTGFSHEEIMSSPFSARIHRDDRKIVNSRNERRLKGDKVPTHYQFRLLTKDNDYIWVKLNAAKVIAWENRPALLGYLSDITQRKKNWDAQLLSEKMISVSGLAAGIAHEINNPLAGIMQSAQNILRRIDPEIQANQSIARSSQIDLHRYYDYLQNRDVIRSLQGIRLAGERASSIIRNMLQFVQKNEEKMESCEINTLFANALNLIRDNSEFEESFEISSIEVVTELNEDLLSIPCMKNEIEQVLINLLLNAFQSVDDNRSVRDPKVIIKTEKEVDYLKIEIEDNGAGINQQTLGRVFEPFFTTKPVGQGVGIGLSISYMIVTYNHDGIMEVVSDPEWGSRFVIKLPLERPQSQPKQMSFVDLLGNFG